MKSIELSKKGHYFIIASLLVIYVFSALQFWNLTIDDAYITARYARNAALGYGLVYNVNERVMGYTNLLLTIIEMVIYRVGGDGIFWAKFIGMISGGMIVLITFRFFRIVDIGPNLTPGYLAALFLVATPYLANNSVNGLETDLFSLFLLFSIMLFTQGWLSNDWTWKRQAGISITLFMATMARPEAFGYAIFLLIVQVVSIFYNLIKKNNDIQYRTFIPRISWAFGYIVMLVPVLVILSTYYGSPLPNTFFAKTAAGFAFGKYRAGITYFLNWLNDIGGLVLFIPLILFPFLNRTKVKVFGFLLFLFIIQAGYIAYIGGDWMPSYRFIVPLMPIFFVILSMGIYQFWIILREHLDYLSSYSRNILVLILLTILVSYGALQFFSTIKSTTARAQGELVGHDYIGKWFVNNAQPDDTIALMDIGRIGYLSNLYVIDITGLVNHNIASIMHNDIGSITSTWPSAQIIAAYVLSLNPDYIILNHTSEPGDELFIGRTHDVAIWASEVFQSNYEYLFSQPYVDEFQSVYRRIEP
jgi:arabinofuranosyltransferase